MASHDFCEQCTTRAENEKKGKEQETTTTKTTETPFISMNNSLAQLLISLHCLILFPVKPILPDYFAIDLLLLMAYLNDS